MAYIAHRVHVFAVRLALAAACLLPSTALAVDLFFQDFESVPLGPVVTFQTQPREREAWSATFPAGWSVDNSGFPSGVVGDPNAGVTEFEGWTIVDKNWWVNSEDQGRGGFVNGLGKVAVADTDEYDDFGSPAPSSLGPFDSKLNTPSINLMGAAPNTVNVAFHSSWMPEEIQKATLTAHYNNGTNVEVLRWHSEPTDPKFHASAVNEVVQLPLQNPAGASSVALEFRMFDATNNWWWAIDNISVFTGAGTAADGVLRAVIDRDTSDVKIVNNTGQTVNLRGYSLRSAAGAFDESNAAFLADSDPNWIQLTAPNAAGDLSEGHLASYNFANNGAIDFGNDVWRKFYRDAGDVTFSYLVAGKDTPITGLVEFTGNNGNTFPYLDLNFNGAVEIGDWDTFRASFPAALTGLPEIQRYQLGDLDNDGKHTLNDFLVFKREYDAALGSGAFEAALAASQVPEPASSGLALVALIGAAGCWKRRRAARSIAAIFGTVLALLLAFSASSAQAQLTLLNEDFESLPLGPSIEEPNTGDHVWTKTPPAGWTVDDSAIPGINEPPENNGRIEWAGWAFTDKTWWSTQVDGQLRETFNRASGTVMTADPDEWDDEAHPSGLYNAFVTTLTVPIPAGIPAGRIKLAFDSSWRDECCDDNAALDNSQTATIDAIYNGGTPVNVLKWDSTPGSATFHDDAPNEAVVLDLKYNGTSTDVALKFGLTRAENDWWWAVDNVRVFVPADPSILRVNTTTGQVSIVGGDVIPTPINSIDIQSPNGALNGAALAGLSTSKPDSVDGPDPDSTVGNSSGETWQMLSATNNRVSEAFLYGDSVFNSSRTVSLGSIFNTSTPAANRDITFSYTTRFFDVVTGIVEYVTSPGVPGDYNSNGVVDAADYVAWRNNLGQSVMLPNDATPGSVTQADYDVWRANFGKIATGSSAALAAVPEPPTGQILFLVGSLLAVGGLRRGGWLWLTPGGPTRRVTVPARASLLALACALIAASFSGPARAAVPPPPVLDRNYRMGDDPFEAASAGGTVTSTFDSAGVAGMQQLIDLSAVGAPKYEALPTTSGGPVPRRPDNGTGLAIRLNPTATSQGQYLRTGFEQALNWPEGSWSSTFTPGGTINYSFIDDRGFQLWVLPQSSGRADIVMDTNQHGALVNASGNFAMRYANTDYDTGVPVMPNNWYHLMVVRPFGPDMGSIMYINGKAVARASGTYAGEADPLQEDTTPLVVGANTSNVAFQVGAVNRFQGLVDDLEMFVMGLNNAKDYGEFVFERDNKYAAFFKPTNAADLTGDNTVNMADVSLFVNNWLFQNNVGGAIVGDLTSRMKGDFNYDGFVDLKDWRILNELAPPGVGAAALAMINGAVPEPSSLCLAAMLAAASLRFRWPRRPDLPH